MTETQKPVTLERIAIATKFGIRNAAVAARACREAGLPFWAACALLQKESSGRNVYGHDDGGALSGYPFPVDESNYKVFLWLVTQHGQTSNGVGPCQITYAGPLRDGKRDGGYFSQMEKAHLRPWHPRDNMFFGFTLLKNHHKAEGTWKGAGTRYNGDDEYGVDLVAKCNEWRKRLHIKGGPVQ